MNRINALLLIGCLFAPSQLAAEAGAGAAKCGVPPTIYLADGRIAPDTVLRTLDPKTIESLAVTCTDVRHRIFGLEPGRSLVMLFTKAAPTGEMKSNMDRIASLQQAHFERHGTFARTLAELRWRPVGSTRVSLCVTEDGLQWQLLAADDSRGGSSYGGRASTIQDRYARLSCDVRAPGVEEVLHWIPSNG